MFTDKSICLYCLTDFLFTGRQSAFNLLVSGREKTSFLIIAGFFLLSEPYFVFNDGFGTGKNPFASYTYNKSLLVPSSSVSMLRKVECWGKNANNCSRFNQSFKHTDKTGICCGPSRLRPISFNIQTASVSQLPFSFHPPKTAIWNLPSQMRFIKIRNVTEKKEGGREATDEWTALQMKTSLCFFHSNRSNPSGIVRTVTREFELCHVFVVNERNTDDGGGRVGRVIKHLHPLDKWCEFQMWTLSH